jgi:hypothetical protein
MSHATARPRPADTSFESQTPTTAGRRIESDPAGASQRYEKAPQRLAVTQSGASVAERAVATATGYRAVIGVVGCGRAIWRGGGGWSGFMG